MKKILLLLVISLSLASCQEPAAYMIVKNTSRENPSSECYAYVVLNDKNGAPIDYTHILCNCDSIKPGDTLYFKPNK